MSLSKPGLLDRFARGPEDKTPPIPRIWTWILLPVWIVCGAVEAAYAVYRPTEQAVQRKSFRKARARF